ncbi:hypothetical protein Tco_0650734 [Tanacetum coccineum]
MVPGKGDLHDYWRDISTDGDFLGPPPSYTLIRDPVGLDVRSVNIPYLLAQNLRRFTAGRKSRAHISNGKSVTDLYGGDDTWAWVAMGPERQPDAVVGAFEAAEDAHVVDEGGQGLCRDVVSLRGLVERSMTDQGRFSTWMISYMAQLMEGSGLTYHAFDGTFRGSSPIEF